MDLKEIEVRNIENAIKRIFNKEVITESDVRTANFLIEKWKKLTNWIERTELPIKIN
jgi:hypothetical protein